MGKKKAEKLLHRQATREEAVEVLKRAVEILEKMDVELRKKNGPRAWTKRTN